MFETKVIATRDGVPLRVAKGHFATNHSHINYFIDITTQKTRLAEANAEGDEILKAAYRKSQLRDEEMLKEAQEKASQTLRRATEQVALEKKRAMNEIKDEVSDMAVDIAAAVLARDIKAEEHKQLIDSFIDNFGESHD